MSPKSQARRPNGQLHLKSGPIPYRYIKVPKPEVLSDGSLAEQVEPEIIQTAITSNPGLEALLAPEIDKVKGFSPKVYPQGPRDMHNQGKHLKFMVIPEFAEHTFGRPAKKPDGTMGLRKDTRAIALYTLAPHGKDYEAKGKREVGRARQHFVPVISRAERQRSEQVAEMAVTEVLR